MRYTILFLGLLTIASCKRQDNVKVTKTFKNGKPLQEFVFINGKSDSLNYDVRQYNENETVELIGQMRNGRQEGSWTWYHPNGNKKWVDQYKNGKSVDTTYCYYESGRIERIIHPSATKTRKAVEFYETGELKIISFLTNAKFIDSLWTAYFKSGQIKEFGRLRFGRRRGIWKFYSDQGKLIDSVDMTNKRK